MTEVCERLSKGIIIALGKRHTVPLPNRSDGDFNATSSDIVLHHSTAVLLLPVQELCLVAVLLTFHT